jgi:hypothetical protein
VVLVVLVDDLLCLHHSFDKAHPLVIQRSKLLLLFFRQLDC